MAPDIAKHYPITTSIFSYIPPCDKPSSSPTLQLDSLQLDSSTSLAHLLNIPMNGYLKKVIRHLKNVFEGFPRYIVTSITISSTQGTFSFSGEIIVQEVLMRPSTILEAMKFLNLGFLISQSLLTMVTYSCGNGLHIEEAELAKLKKLKEHLLTLIGFLSRISIAYTCSDIKGLPDISIVKRMAKKLRKSIRSLKPQSFPQLLPNSVVTEEDILCSVLGLQHDVADRLRKLDPLVRSDQSDMYLLQGFLVPEDGNPEISGSLANTDAVSSKLQKMGFTQARSVVIAKWIAEQRWAEHQSLLAWAQYYIQNLFAYDIFLNDRVSRYPYQENKLNEWFSVSIERDGDDDAVVNSEVKIINTHCSRASEFIQEIVKKNELHPIYYHGTDHMSAKSILEDGIHLGMGKSGCDFSSGSGFYLADCSKYATEWAKKSTAAAVLMFSISEDCLNANKIFDLSNESQKLREVRDHFRMNKTLSRTTRRECRNCDYIKGPLDSIPNGVTQICINSEEMAVRIGNAAHLCAVIFMNNE